MPIDVHQHLWPGPFLDALRARREPPRLSGWTLELPGAAPFEVDPAAHDVARRAAAAEDDLVGVAVSAGLGLDRLPAPEAAALAAVWLDAALALPAPFRAWAMAGLEEPDPGALRAALSRGAIG